MDSGDERKASAESRKAAYLKMGAAMQSFVEGGDAAQLESAIAGFVELARARGVAIEQVIADLEGLADVHETARVEGKVILPRTDLRRLMLRGVLLAFYGVEAVGREETAQEERRMAERRQPPRPGHG